MLVGIVQHELLVIVAFLHLMLARDLLDHARVHLRAKTPMHVLQ